MGAFPPVKTVCVLVNRGYLILLYFSFITFHPLDRVLRPPVERLVTWAYRKLAPDAGE